VRFSIAELQAAELYDAAAADADDRLRLLEWLADHGATIEQMVRFARAGSLVALATELGRARGPRLTLEQASAQVGLPADQIEDILFAVGLPVDPADPILTEDDARSLAA
jgi:hypothetical protein